VEDGLVLTRRISERGVHETAQRAGAGPLRGVVRQSIGYEEWEKGPFVRREMARHGVALILGFGDSLEVFEGEADSPARVVGAFAVGNQARSSLTGVRGHQFGAQVELTPAGALALFGNVADLNDAVVPLDEALGARGTDLLERLGEASSWGGRFDLIDEALGAVEPLPLSSEVEWLHRQLLRSKGRARVERLMDETGRSRRHVTERFRGQLGIPPKAFARLLRFEHAASLLSDQVAPWSLAAVAAEAGYYDQSHLNRDFVGLAGMTPGAYAAGRGRVPEVRFVQDEPVAVGPEWAHERS
jgi:AraC-like DNA-binding protein